MQVEFEEFSFFQSKRNGQISRQLLLSVSIISLLKSLAQLVHCIIIILTILCGLKILECKKGQIYDIGFIDPYVVHQETVKDNPEETKNIMLRAMRKQYYKR